jgi:hypothetical protein
MLLARDFLTYHFVFFCKWDYTKYFFHFFIASISIHMCIHCLGHLSPLPPFPLLTSPPPLFCPLVLRFCWRENIRDNRKDIVFLLVWDKDSYTERFLVLLPRTCALQPTLVHFYQTSSLLPSPLPIVASASLRLLYLLVYNGHISYIQVFGFLPFPYLSQTRSPLGVWPMSNNITVFDYFGDLLLTFFSMIMNIFICQQYSSVQCYSVFIEQ